MQFSRPYLQICLQAAQ